MQLVMLKHSIKMACHKNGMSLNPEAMKVSNITHRELSTYKHGNAGFTLIELMIVVAIIGILGSIAISSYQTYTVRAQVTEGLYLAGNAKVPVVDAYLVNGEAPTNRSIAGLTDVETDTFGKYVKSVEVVNGRLDITFGNEANALIQDAILRLTPYETSSGATAWRCGHDDRPTSSGSGTALQPLGTAGGGVASSYEDSTVEPRYLPSTCR
jgi:type IV pilus assembly protein PilA